MPTLADIDPTALVEEQTRVDAIGRRLRGQTRAGAVDLGGQGRARLAFLDSRHPIYVACEEAWERNERRIRGGEDVLDELKRFDWESRTPPAGEERTHYEIRRDRATYINLPDMFATTTLGHLMRDAPAPGAGLDFGTLGEVRRERDASAPTRAELIYYNADGVGNDGSQWDNFWNAALKRAMATGHRWIMVEAPREAPGNFARELDGLRPYLVEFDPGSVTNWHYDLGRLQWAVVRVSTRRPIVNGRGQLSNNDAADGYLLMVRNGCSDLGTDFASGGWWLYDSKKVLLGEGRWTNTQGEIPMFPLYYERDTGTKARPAMSRSGLTELGAIAVSYMDLLSAWQFDAWDAAMSVTFLRGVDRDGFNLAVEKMAEGSRFIPLMTEERSGHVPDIQDGSTGAVTADVFERLTNAMFAAAERVSTMEATSAPESSGASKVAGFNEEKAPRLALAASNLEQAQNTAIHFLELRWGTGRPAGSVVWPRKFELVDLIDEIRSIFELEKVAGIHSATLGKKLMIQAVREKGLVTDDAEATAIENEYAEDAKAAQQARQQERTLASEFGVE